MIGNALQDHEAVGDILCAGGVLVKRLGQISASSAASAVRKIVTGPFLQSSSAVGLAPTLPSRRHYQLLRLIDEPAAAVAAGKLTTAAADLSPVRSTSVVGEAAT